MSSSSSFDPCQAAQDAAAALFHPKGGHGTGVNPFGYDYPFVDPGDDIRGALSDAYLWHQHTEAVLPLRLYWAYGLNKVLYASSSDSLDLTPAPSESSSLSLSSSSSATVGITLPTPTHAVDILIVDAADQIIFDSTQASFYRGQDFGDRLRIHEWIITDTAVCRIVQHTHWSDDVPLPCLLEVMTPINAVFDERVSDLAPPSVRSITVDGRTFRGDIKLQNGFNTTVVLGTQLGFATLPTADPLAVIPTNTRVISPQSGRITTRVTLAAQPGSGLGRYPGCEDVGTLIKTINNLPPDENGNFTLDAGGCYYIRQPITISAGAAVPTAATLKIGNDCGPCCECVDFENTYKGLINVHGRYQELGTRFRALRTLFGENVGRWNTQLACRQQKPLRLSTAVSGSSLYVTGLFCNFELECVTDLQLDFSFSTAAAGTAGGCTDGAIAASSVTMTRAGAYQAQPGTLDGTYPNVSALWDVVEPGKSVKVNFVVSFTCGTDQMTRVTTALSGAVGGDAVPTPGSPQVITNQDIIPKQ